MFKLKNLEILLLINCAFERISGLDLFNIEVLKLKEFSLNGISYSIWENYDILGKLDGLENLTLSYIPIKQAYFSKLNIMCNLSLKILCLDDYFLEFIDLQRMEKLEVLENLYLCNRKFQSCYFHYLGNNCRFFQILQILDLSFLKINLDDLKYIMKFENKRKLSLMLSNFDLMSVKNFLVALPLNELSIGCDF
ncbi:hypothetical protein CWI38_2311p0010 [Hamiltosporidium tvaerminnensis]|uniref:Leucine-rich repeat-containing protein n=1 Tax=Hamiltosporidium tvaerminnensis TaxID=1176355 RepID=A0A4Q9LL28_9MICR|nr:hypothetical protein CWI38_2311p0010 [Hamiltosporidium tvaerminnensis]